MPAWADTLPQYLEEHSRRFDPASALARDPIRFVRRWPEGNDQEVVSLLAALLSYGRVASIGRAIEDLLDRMGPTPADSACGDDHAGARKRFDGFVHRVTRGDDVARVWLGLGHIVRAYGSLGSAMAKWNVASDDDLRPLLQRLRSEIIAGSPGFSQQRSFEHFLSNPAKGSACKRYMMWLRWMVRGPDAIDLGVWSFLDPSRLRLPLDTHIQRIGRNLGLIQRRSADWRTAEEITNALRTIDPEDPLRFDFALAHLGISGECPTYQVEAVCRQCPLQPVCQLPEDGNDAR